MLEAVLPGLCNVKNLLVPGYYTGSECDLSSGTPCWHCLRRHHTACVRDSPPPSVFVLHLEVNVDVETSPACNT